MPRRCAMFWPRSSGCGASPRTSSILARSGRSPAPPWTCWSWPGKQHAPQRLRIQACGEAWRRPSVHPWKGTRAGAGRPRRIPSPTRAHAPARGGTGGGGGTALVERGARPNDCGIRDGRMPEVDGLWGRRGARGRPEPPEVVVMTAHGTAESAVEAMKQGAADYLIKPFAIEELRIRVRRLADQREGRIRNRGLVERLTPALVAESARMKAALESARRVAPTDTTVLLLGESGTGKTQLAPFAHFASLRAQG